MAMYISLESHSNSELRRVHLKDNLQLSLFILLLFGDPSPNSQINT